MHLASKKRQKVQGRGGETFDFRAGETIHTENSYKYTLDSFAALARGAGWTPGGLDRCRPNIFVGLESALARSACPPDFRHGQQACADTPCGALVASPCRAKPWPGCAGCYSPAAFDTAAVTKGWAMKIVGFEAGQGLRLGVVEGDQVIDLQAVDPEYAQPISAKSCARAAAT